MCTQKTPRIKLRQDTEAIFDLGLRIESQPDVTRERLVCARSGHFIAPVIPFFAACRQF
jgi:hypothetical protein